MDTFLDSRWPQWDSAPDAYRCTLRAACRSQTASSRICSWRHSSLQKGVSPLYMKTSPSRLSGLAQSAHASNSCLPGSATGSESKKKAHARDAAMVFFGRV
ncbi:unnamed protein product, partial [Alopecurus aequalis]